MSYQRSRLLASACACVLGMAAMQAYGQAAPAANAVTELEEVVVTGSFIKGTPEDTAMPVEVIGLEQLRNMGSPTNIDMVKMMTEVGQSAGETNRYNNFPIGAATINLRNLGSRFTLVLFNGRRFPEQYSVSVGRFNNIAWIPNAAIGRVETLKEGGGVTYGADAIGGVVNYLTRSNFNGLELKGSYRYIENDSGDYTADALWGKKFGASDIMVSASYQHRGILRSLDRDWARRQYLENDPALGWALAGSPGSYLFQTQVGATGTLTPGAFTSISAAAAGVNQYGAGASPGTSLYQQSAGGTIRDPQCSALGGFAGWSATPTPVCYFQLGQFEKLVEKNDQFNVYAEFNHHFDSGVKYHAEVLAYYQNVPDITAHPSDGPLVYPMQPGSATGATQISGPGASAYFVPGANPAVGQFLGTVKNSDGTNAYSATQITNITAGGRTALSGNTWRLFGNGGNPVTGAYDVQHNWSKLYRMTNQLTGDLPDFWGSKWKWDVAITYDHVVDRKEINDMLIDRLQAGLNGLGGPNCTGTTPGANGCMYLNPFNSAIRANMYTGAVNPGFVGSGSFTGYDAGIGLQNNLDMIRWMYVPIWLKRTYEDITFDPIVTAETGINLPGGAIAVAFGGQFRYRSENTQLDDISNRTKNPCATLGVTTCINPATGVAYPGVSTVSGALAFARPSTVLGAPNDLLDRAANGHTNRKFPAAAVFFETQLPILDNVNASVAGRYEKFYSDITDRDNQVFVPAASIKWQALDWMAVRGSAGKTFSQVNPPLANNPVATNPAANATYGVSVGTANYNNVDVKPMKGKYFDIGFLIKAGDFQANLDWYDIKVDEYTRTMTSTSVISALVNQGQPSPGQTNTINCSSPLLSPQAIFGGRPFVELNGPCLPGSALNSVSTGPTSPGGLTNGRINFFGTTDETNSGELHTSGIDLNASYNFNDVAGGVLTPSLDFTYVLKWTLGDFVVGGVTVTPAYDGLGFRNTSTTRNGQAVPEYRATFGVNYHMGNHNVNIAVRYLPSVIDENPALYNETAARNANVGVNGVVTSGTPSACTGAYATDTNPTSNLGAVPAGAGTGLYGIGSVVVPNPPGVLTPAVGTGAVGFCGNQNFSILSGQTVKAQMSVDLTYRVNLPAEVDLAFTVYNLTDQDPEFARNNINYDAGFGSPLGRNFKLEIAKRF